MRPTRASKSIAAWLAAFGMLMAALAPALSHALGSEPARGWAEVCSALGWKIVNVEPTSGSPRPASDAGHLLEHCPYCSMHATWAALPPSPAATLALPALSFELPRLFLRASRSLFAWTAPPSRAPPLSV